MKHLLILCLLLCACRKATNIAQKVDPSALCVHGEKNDIAYCIIRGAPYICDVRSCLPAICAAQIAPVLERPPSGVKGDQ